jgi:hypothetical protein
MRKKIPLTLAYIVTTLFCSAQKTTSPSNENPIAQNSFFAELGGPGILFSANIDHRFNKSNLGFGGRMGIGFVSGYLEPDPYYDKPTSVATFPVQLNYLFGKPGSPHTFEVGAGFTATGKKINVFDYSDSTASNFFVTASFMYRRQPPNGGFSWRIGFTPIITKGYIQPSAAVSFGYNF